MLDPLARRWQTAALSNRTGDDAMQKIVLALLSAA
jgi:hypothetical protein